MIHIILNFIDKDNKYFKFKISIEFVLFILVVTAAGVYSVKTGETGDLVA